MTNSKISIAIVGGGIGGSALAAALQKCELLDVQVFEATKEYADVGSGLAIHPNGIRAMEMLGDEVKMAYFRSAELSVEDAEQELTTEVMVAMGRHANEMLAFLGTAKGRKTVARADMLTELAKLVQGDRIHFGKRLMRIEEHDNKVFLHFKDGTSASADCLIGADGIRSTTRKYLLGEDHPATAPTDQGWIFFRRMVPMEEAGKTVDPQLLNKVPIYCGERGAINCMPIHGGRTYSITAGYLRDLNWSQDELDKHLAFEPEFFKDWIPEVRIAAELVKKNPGEPWIVEDHDPAPYYNRRNVVMIGDAAHAITPFAGNGAAQAFEDATTMHAIFQQVIDVSQIPKAFEAFDAIRRPHSQKVVAMSRQFGSLYAFVEPGVGDDLNQIRKIMGESAPIMSNHDLEKQNQNAVDYFNGLL